MLLIFSEISEFNTMLDEYKGNSVWKENIDTVSIRSDLLVSERAINLLGDVQGKKILDAGCGNGKVARVLEKKEAVVFGVDKVNEQIITARQASSGIQYFEGDLVNLNAIDLPKDFDIAISLMAFLYLDEQEFAKALGQIKDHLKEGGRFVWANIHPSRYEDGAKIEDELPTADGKTFKTTFYNHSMEFIKQSFADVGFKIKEILEPMPTKDEVEKYPALFSKDINTSQYLIIDASL